jgi:hypothetical protein
MVRRLMAQKEPASAHAQRPVITVRTLVVAALLVLTIIGVVVMLSTVASTILLLLLAIVFAEGVRPAIGYGEALRLPRVADQQPPSAACQWSPGPCSAGRTSSYRLRFLRGASRHPGPGPMGATYGEFA